MAAGSPDACQCFETVVAPAARSGQKQLNSITSPKQYESFKQLHNMSLGLESGKAGNTVLVTMEVITATSVSWEQN